MRINPTKRIIEEVEALGSELEQKTQEYEELKILYENSQKLKFYKIVVLLDGDGAIFSPEFIARGRDGGHSAAYMLSDRVQDFVKSNGDLQQFNVRVYVFCNKQGLGKTLQMKGHLENAPYLLEAFMNGFNQASERFLMVDVGGNKEAADSKMRALLEDEIHSPSTYKIVFGGCHDNGYTNTLSSHITAGNNEKLILLQSYDTINSGFLDLRLPIIRPKQLEGLFIPKKLGENGTTQARKMSWSLSGTPGPPSVATYAQAASTPAILSPTNGHRKSGSSIESEGARRSFRRDVGPIRTIEESQSVSELNPKPCINHYLGDGCTKEQCKWGHRYILLDKHYEELQQNTKRYPCEGIKNGEGICPWGETCWFGHVCPYGPGCVHMSQGKCWFPDDKHHDF